jgi:hypothetical protein
MLLNDIVKRVNKLISNNSSYNLNFAKLEFYIDSAIDRINEVLKENFKTPREYFEDNFVDEVISYSDKYLGVFEKSEDIPVDSISDGYIYYQTKDVSGYYLRQSGVWVLVDDLSDLSGIISFADVELNNYVSKFNYRVIPERYTRSCIIYFAAAYYLEEEDELENQYAVYKDKAEQSLLEWQQLDYSVYDISKPKEHKRRKLLNPYGDFCDD